jgi:alpha-amylase
LWDLGEFDQKGTTRSKWGSFADLQELAKIAQNENVLLYFDAVLNHKAAADEKEKCKAIEVDWEGTQVFFWRGTNDRPNQDSWRGDSD